MYPDECRSHAEMERLRKTYFINNPNVLYAKLKDLESRKERLGSSDDVDNVAGEKRRISELFHALKAEREISASLSAELAETQVRLSALRSSRTMKAGRMVKAPFVLTKTALRQARHFILRPRTRRRIEK